MKTIYLVRHAKSDWKNAHNGDFDRTLNERGLKAAPFMAALLKEKKVFPELVISSPAIRAITTAELFCDTLDYPKEQILQRIEIYEGGVLDLLKVVQQIPDNCTTAMLFGHNPMLTEFSNLLAGSYIDNLATCGTVRIDMDIDSWKNANPDAGELIWYDAPKKHQERD
ncbi:MAG: histidine phosphatase family protein [Chlorobium sp.]|nr:histidine phosphatase family protein [Chlorobium sp.]